MLKTKDLPLFLLCIGFFIGAKFAYHAATTDQLYLFLYPINFLVELSSNSIAQYSAENGFVHTSLGIHIEKSCSGFNFFLLCFSVLSYSLLKSTTSFSLKFALLGLNLVLAYLLNIFINSARIIASIGINNYADRLPVSATITHEAIGVITNLIFLILIYLSAERLVKSTKLHAQTT